MQKFTRPITREIELGGERLALTLTETGVSVRPVGSRRPPLELSWAALLAHATSGQASEPPAEQLSAAVQKLKGGGRPARSPTPSAAVPPAASPAPAAPAAEQAPRRQESPKPAGGDVAGLLDRLEKWLTAHRPNFHRGLNRGATPEELSQLQEPLGMPVPDDLRALLAWHNGQDDKTTGCFQGSWFLMRTQEIARAYQEVTGGGGAGGWQRAWVPFLEDNRGNYVFLDTSQPGPPVREFWQGSTEQRTVAPSLAAWLGDFVAAVERGEYAEDPERGRFLRQSAPKP